MNENYREKIRNITVPKYDSTMLMALSVAHEEWHSGKKINLETEKEIRIHHIMVNFIRHQTVQDYHRLCKSPSFKENQAEYFQFFKAVNHEIGQVYPFLRSTVAQQISHKRKQIFG